MVIVTDGTAVCQNESQWCRKWWQSWHEDNSRLSVSLNPMWPNDAIWRHKSGSTWAKVVACCLMTPSHYVNQCRLVINGTLWHAPDSNVTKSTQEFNPFREWEISTSLMSFKKSKERSAYHFDDLIWQSSLFAERIFDIIEVCLKDAILQTLFSNAFSWRMIFTSGLKCLWNVCLNVLV